MNPFSTGKSALAGMLMFVGFSSLLVASDLQNEPQQNNGLTAAQLQLIEQEACPYPPQTPAAAGVERGQPDSSQPGMMRRPAPLVRPAVYVELLVPSGDDSQVILDI